MTTNLRAFLLARHVYMALVLWLLTLPGTASAQRPSLARLSFWVAPERMADFERTYESQIVPLLDAHGLVPSSETGRATVDSVFSRLFEFDSPDAMRAAYVAMGADSSLAAMRRRLRPFSGIDADSIRSRFYSYDVRVGTGNSVRAGDGARRGAWHTYTMVDGLASQGVNGLLQDRAGALWIAASYFIRLTRFDGAHFVTLSEEDGLNDIIRSLVEDHDGNLWFTWSRDQGVARFDGDRITSFTDADGVPGGSNGALLVDHAGVVWVGAETGVGRFDGATFTSPTGLNVDGSVTDMFEDRDGDIWIGTRSDRVVRYDGTTSRQYTTADGLLAENGISSGIQGFAQTADGRLWIGSSGGLNRFDGTTFEGLTMADGLAGSRITDVSLDTDGDLWISAWGGVSRYDGEHFENFTTRNGLPQTWTGDILEDRAGNLWIATGGGLTRYVGRQFLNFTTEQALMQGGVMSVGQGSDGIIWFGSWEGMSKFDGRRFVADDSLAAFNQTWKIYQDRRQRLWFGSFGGDPVRYVEDGSITTFRMPDGETLHIVRAIAEDHLGNLWFGGQRDGSMPGLRRYDGVRVREFTTADGLVDDAVNDMVVDGENLWISTEHGISRYDGTSFTSFTTADGLIDDGVWRMTLDNRGHLWAGTRSGVSRYDGQTWASLTRANGLGGDFAFSILQDRRGTMWFGHWDGGVSRYDGTVFQTITMADGLIHDAVQDMFEDDHGDVWIATEGGITRYRPQTVAPGISVQNVTGDGDLGAVSAVVLSTAQDYLAFECLGSSFNTPSDRLVYVYRMLGVDSTWQWTPDPRIVFNDLPRGAYAFEVKAVDRDLNYSHVPARVQVTIEPDYADIVMTGSLGVTLLGLVLASTYGVRRRRERDQSRRALAHEQRQRLQAQKSIDDVPPDWAEWRLEDFVEPSPAMQKVFARIRELRQQPGARALLQGDAGTDKVLLARALHFPDTSGAFVLVPCGSLPQDLQDLDTRTRVLSQILGHASGAFPGADEDHIGWVQQADGGTLFLDEVGLLPLPLQSQLERVLSQGSVRRLGENTAHPVALRVVAASQIDLQAQVELGLFNRELFRFIGQNQLEVPPLRQRPEDIAALVELIAPGAMSAQALARLQSYDLPGNNRELRALLAEALQASGGQQILAEHLSLPDERMM